MFEEIPNVVTYSSRNNKPEWFAYLMPGGTFLGVRFEGATEAEAIERAKSWWVSERAHQKKLCGAVELEDDEVASTSYKPVGVAWGNPPKSADGFSSSWGEPKPHHAHGLAGKVWMIDHTNKIKKRVAPEEVASYEANGYVKGGPKTAFKD